MLVGHCAIFCADLLSLLDLFFLCEKAFPKQACNYVYEDFEEITKDGLDLGWGLGIGMGQVQVLVYGPSRTLVEPKFLNNPTHTVTLCIIVLL